MVELLGDEVTRQCLLVAHRSTGGRFRGAVPFDGCECCDAVLQLTHDTALLAREDHEVRLVCVECAWAATRAVEGRSLGVGG